MHRHKNNSGGNSMSLKQSAKRRLSWLAGSSLVTAGLAAASTLGLSLAPTSAQAQTCTPATAPAANPGPDTYTCLAGTFPTGIAYSSDGNLTVNMAANGAVVNTTLTANGADLTGNGSDSVTWDSTVGTVTGAAGTVGPVIDALTASGAINITTSSVIGSAATVTHGIRARSTSGAINITTGVGGSFPSVTATNNPAGVNAIEAATAGNITILAGGSVNGRQRSIFTNTSSGAGTTTINTTGAISGGGIEAVTGTGAVTVNLNGIVGPNNTTTTRVTTSGAGAATINLVAGNARLQLLDLNSSATSTVNINSGTELGQSVFSTNDFLLGQGAATGPIVINNEGRITGRFNFAAVTGDITIHNNNGENAETQGWATGGLTTLGSGDDLIENGPEGVIKGSPTTTIDFGAGDDRLVNTGRLITEVWLIWGPGHMTLSNLETFENSGLILLGSEFLGIAEGATGLISDGSTTDRLIAHGVDFIGSGDSRIGLDVDLADITQADCSVTPVAADCVDFTGGSTSGSTLLTIRDERRLDYIGALNDGITVLLGVSAAEHFTLDPNSDYYAETSTGPVLQKKLVAYRLVYDEATERLMFVGTLADEAFQAGTFAASAQETWRSTTGSWLTRQADLRSTPGGLRDSEGAWVRIGAAASEREATGSYVQDGTTYDYDLTHKQNTSHLLLGVDLLRANSADSAGVVGGMIGFVRSDVQFDATPTETITTGFTGGLYASYVTGPLFIDGVLNFNLLHLKAEVPNMNLGEDVPLKQDIQSVGGQVEAGWRFNIGAGAFVEPLGGVSYVATRFDDLEMPAGGGAIEVDDRYVSLRAGAGLRLGMDSQLLGMTSSYSLTGRYWRETEGENASAIFLETGGATTELMDDFSGSFSELAGSVSLYSDDGGVSGFVSLGGKFADDYRSVDGSVGVRLRW
jgi:hypothetical protein